MIAYNFIADLLSKGMIKTFKQQIQEDQNMQSQLAEGWGYQVDKSLVDSRKQKQKVSTSPEVAKITPRKFGKEIVKTQRIKQVEDQIKALQNERLLRQLRQVKQESSINQKSEIITLMEKVIQEYNDLIEHKHLQQKNAQIRPQTPNVAVPQQNNDAKLILKEIKSKEIQLNTGNLWQQIKLNRQISQSYRKYQMKLYNEINRDSLKKKECLYKQVSLSDSEMKKYQSETFKKHKFSKPKKQSNLNLKQIKQFRQLQNKRYLASKKRQNVNLQQMDISNRSLIQSNMISQKKALKDPRNLQRMIDSPYLNKKQVDDYKQLQNKVNNNNQVLQLWKLKMKDFFSNFRLIQQLENAEKIKQTTKIQQQSNLYNLQSQIQQFIDRQIKIIDISAPNNISKNKRAKLERLHEQQKQIIFSQLLRKKHSKFSRLWGTKILVKYDPVTQAKLLLKGQADRSPKDTTESHEISPKKQKTYKSMERTRLTPLSARNEDELYDWRQERGDQQHYWRMCKNEKINILLKRK